MRFKCILRVVNVHVLSRSGAGWLSWVTDRDCGLSARHPTTAHSDESSFITSALRTYYEVDAQYHEWQEDSYAWYSIHIVCPLYV